MESIEDNLLVQSPRNAGKQKMEAGSIGFIVQSIMAVFQIGKKQA